MTLLKTLTALAQSVVELPNALHACVEMAREAEANRASIRASEAFESAFPDGPALYHANSQIEELTKKLFSAETERKKSQVRPEIPRRVV